FPSRLARAAARASSSVAPAARASSTWSSRCWAISSTISASRVGTRRAGARRARMSSRNSRIFPSGDAGDGGHERLPGAAVAGEDLLSLGGELVEAAAPLARLLDPLSLQPAALLQAVEERVQRRDVELHHAAGQGVDEPRQLVAVTRPRLEQREDHELGAPL